ncbi:alpha-2,8-sialyltransferase 8F-like [Mantella aurantiaca]
MVRRYHWKVILILNTVLVCYLFHQNRHSQTGTGGLRSQAGVEHDRLKKKVFFQAVKELQMCPWIENPTERRRMQESFQESCNASYSMIVTQENSPMGYKILYESQRRTREVTEILYSVLPKTSPFKKPIKSCAVVGNGGILNNSFCGNEIDQADFVFRINLPPLNRTDDVGAKTDLVHVNPSMLIKKFSGLKEKRMEFINVMKEYGSSLVLLSAFSFWANTDVSFRTLYTIEDFDLESKVVFFNPDYYRKLIAHWKKKGLKFQRLSSGLIMASVAAEVCEKVTLYGFWPFSEDLDGIFISHHYYDNVRSKSKIHALPDEFYWYLQMHAQGSLRLKLGQC